MKVVFDIVAKLMSLVGFVIFIGFISVCAYLLDFFFAPPKDRDLRDTMASGVPESLIVNGKLIRSQRAWVKSGQGMGEPGGICGLYRVSAEELQRLKSIGKITLPERDTQCWTLGPATPDRRICPKIADAVMISFRCQGPDSRTYWVNERLGEVMFQYETYD